MGECNYLVQLDHINKSFFGVKALQDVSFNLKAGEVHALVGENGAGKSTLMKILTGIYKKDSGHVLIKGVEHNLTSVKDSIDLGIAMIHQELNLVNHLTVAQNIFIGKETNFSPAFFQSDKKINEKAQLLCREMGINVEPTVLAGGLSVAKQQMVEIVKAISADADVIIMDEPTASLTLDEIKDLFRIVNKLKNAGKGIIYISHRLEELFEIADRVSVMRDGKMISTDPIEDLDEKAIIKKMVGREIDIKPPVFDESQFGDIALRVQHLKSGDMVKDVSFRVRYGEIVGFAGLVGSGRSESMKAIFGANLKETGDVYVNENKVNIRGPHDAVKLKIAYLSEDRKMEGLITSQPIFENINLPNMSAFLKYHIFLRQAKELKVADKMIDLLDIKTTDSKKLVQYLSGGNQQKVVIAKWLENSNIIIFDEPTRGIDVGAKDQIYDLIKDLAKQGNAIVVVSSEMQELIRLCNRIYVMSEGCITGEISGDEITQEKIMTLAVNRKG